MRSVRDQGSGGFIRHGGRKPVDLDAVEWAVVRFISVERGRFY